MMRTLCFVACLSAPAYAEDNRQLSAHEHGVGQLDIAIEGMQVAMQFVAPGADIVGFEYAATSDADRAAVSAAIETLSAPMNLFVPPAAAECTVTKASSELLTSAEDHDAHEEHSAHDDHDDHDEHKHEDHSAHDDHDEHKHEEHSAHADEAQSEQAGHTEFSASYVLNCGNPSALATLSFSYFETFPNAKELEVQVITEAGANAFEVMRDAPTLTLGGLL